MRIRMLGNCWSYQFGKEYEVPAEISEEDAAKLTGMGYAEEIPEQKPDEEPATPEEE